MSNKIDYTSFFVNSSFSFLACQPGQWRAADGVIHNIANMEEDYKENCINEIERNIEFINRGGFNSQLSPKNIKEMFNIDGRRNVEKYFGEDVETIKEKMNKEALDALLTKKQELKDIYL